MLFTMISSRFRALKGDFRSLQTVSTETDRREPVRGDGTIRPHLTPLSLAALVGSASICLWVIVASILVFTVADLYLAPTVLRGAHALKSLQLVAVLTALWGLRRCRTTATARNLILVTGGILCALVAASGVVANDPSTAVVLCLMLTWCAAVLIPWSAAAQLALAATAAAAIIATLLFTRGDVAVVATYPGVAGGLALGLSALIAHQLDKQRRAVASEITERTRVETALRQAHDVLERSVVERTAQLSATAQALSDSERRFRTVSALTSDYAYAFRLDDDFRATVEWLTEASFQRITGYTAAEAEARGGGISLVHEDDRSIVGRRLENLLAGRGDTSEFRIVTKSGEVRWIREHAEVEWDGVRQRVVRIYGAAQDITERKQAEVTRRATEERFRVLAEQSFDVILLIDADALITYASPSLTRLAGYAPEDAIGRRGLDLIHPEDQAHALQRLGDLIARREDLVAAVQFRVQHRDGSWRYVEAVGTNLLDTAGVQALSITLRDITERKRAQEAVEQVQKQLARVLALSPVVIYALRIEGDGVVSVWNSDNITRLSGYARDETLSLAWWLDHIHPEDVAVFADLAALAELPEREHFVHEFRFRYADGSYAWIRDEARVVRDAGGRPVEIVGSWVDATERKRAEEALQRGERRFRALIDRSVDLVSIMDLDGTYRYVNPAHETVCGCRPEDLVGTSALDRLHPDDAQQLAPVLAQAVQTNLMTATVEYRLPHKDGSWHAFEGVALNLVHDPDVAGILITGRDITERKRAEERTALLLEFAEDTRGTHELDEILDRVQQRIARVLPCDGVVTGYWQADERVFRVIADYGLSAELRDSVRVLKFGPLEPFGDRLSHGDTIVVNDFRDVTPVLAGIAAASGITALIAAPLRIQDRYVGALAAFRTGAGQSFDRNHVDLCTGIAGQLVVAMEALDLRRQLQEDAAVSAALARVGQDLMASLKTSEMLDRLCQITNEVLECDCSYTILRQPDSDMYAVVGAAIDSSAESEEARAVKLPADALTGLLTALDQVEVLQLDMATPPTKWAALPKRYGLSVALYVLVRRGQEIIGVHAAGFRGRQQRFSEVQERIAGGIGKLASVAIENARLLEELEGANRVKSDFVATMSHELRTPLNIIIGYNDLLLSGEFGALLPNQADTLQRTRKSAEELLGLINATLDLSRLEAGGVALEVTDVSVQHLMSELARESVVIQKGTALTWVWRVAPDTPLVRTDAGKLKVVLNNLLRNAAKFTEEGTITVAALGRDGGVEISVSDTGTGIDPEALPIIFEPFRQADSSSTRCHDGVGLGLYIVHRLLQALGGTVTVESTLGCGSNFHVWVPNIRPPTAVAS